MCEPVSISVAVATMASSALQVYQQGQNLKAQAEAEEARHKVEVERAQRDAEMKRAMLDQQALEANQELQLDRERLALEGLRERGAIKASGAESGLGGVSQIRSFLSSNITEDMARATQNINEQNQLFRNQAEQSGININYQDRIQNSAIAVQNAKRQKVGALDYLGAGLSGVGAGLSTYASRGGTFGGSEKPESKVDYHAGVDTSISKNRNIGYA